MEMEGIERCNGAIKRKMSFNTLPAVRSTLAALCVRFDEQMADRCEHGAYVSWRHNQPSLAND